MSDHAAIYLRLSRDDGGLESESISSQRMLLLQYAEAHGIHVSAEFIDDGISGSRWDRDGFQQMLQAIEDGWIGTVLVKDLSRLSRDYIRTGELLERWFPGHGARLIAVNDGVDTGNSADRNDYTAIRAVMDDWYARDISRKVRAAIYARQKAGICTAAALPYGYQRTDGQICIHKPQAAVVRSIFRRYIEGETIAAIAVQLTSARILPPRKKSGHWSDTTVRRILMNKAYNGELMLHTTERCSYKCGKRITLPQHLAICCPVPSIIPNDIFDTAQFRLKSNAHQKTSSHWLSGRVRCSICGSNMLVSKERGDYRLICGNRKRGMCCQNPSLLVSALLNELQIALKAAGIMLPDAALPLLITQLHISPDEILADLRYALPSDCGSV